MASIIDTIIFDLDGVLTNGKQYINATGRKAFKAVSARDKMALRRLIAKGYRIIILTADDWPGAKVWFEDIGCEFIVSKEKDTLPLPFRNSIGVGDDIADKPWLNKCALKFIPADADERLNFVRLNTQGGAGIVCEIERMVEIYEYNDTYYRTDIA